MSREEILDRLVALHDARMDEERQGIIRRLRPEYQVPRFSGPARADSIEAVRDARPAAAAPWPSRSIEQLTALQAFLGGAALTAAEAARRFQAAPTELVRQHLELLTGAGEAWSDAEGRYHRAEQPV
jgi:hypothetical protein